jgi:DNA-binding IclR family transcriptional regulator
MAGDPAPRTVKSADRALAVLELLSTGPRRRSLSEISRELDIPVSSLHAILRTMRRRMWLDVDETGTRFSIGVQALLVGSAYVRVDDAVARAQPVLDWLSDQTGETVHYGRLEGTDVVYLDKRGSRYPLSIHSAVGRRIPAHASALGKAIVAGHAEERVAELFRWPLQALTPHTVTGRDALLAELRGTRQRGFATETEECDQGLGCVAVSVPGRSADAVSLAVPTARLSGGRVNDLAELLLRARRMLAGELAVPRPGGGEGFLRGLK